MSPRSGAAACSASRAAARFAHHHHLGSTARRTSRPFDRFERDQRVLLKSERELRSAPPRLHRNQSAGGAGAQIHGRRSAAACTHVTCEMSACSANCDGLAWRTSALLGHPRPTVATEVCVVYLLGDVTVPRCIERSRKTRIVCVWCSWEFCPDLRTDETTKDGRRIKRGGRQRRRSSAGHAALFPDSTVATAYLYLVPRPRCLRAGLRKNIPHGNSTYHAMQQTA